jgi:uncharacterized repeat protein (TIGR01451 family)
MNMFNLRSKFKNITKRTTLSVIAVVFAAAAVMPAITGGSAVANQQVELEGYIGAMNITDGATEYTQNTEALVDDVVQLQMWYHNMELPDSGKDAENLRVRFDIPSSAGDTQVVTGTVSADNANTVNDTSTIGLSSDKARLEVVEDSATWRYNKGAYEGDEDCDTGMERAPASCYSTEPLTSEQQEQLVGPSGLHVHDKYRPCFAYEESITVQVRVVAAGVSVDKYVRPAGGDSSDWTKDMTVEPGATVEYLIRFRNEGNETLNNVFVGDNLPDYHTYVEDSTMLMNGNHPEGTNVESNDITRGGINVGNYAPGANANVWFTAEIDDYGAYQYCGEYDLRNVGIVHPDGLNPYYNTARLVVDVECEDEPEKPEVGQLICEDLTATHVGDKTFRFNAEARTTGAAEFDSFVYSFGDGSNELVTDQSEVEHTYDDYGTYAARVAVRGTVDGEQTEVTSDACRVTVTISPKDEPEEPEEPELPEELPVTGIGGVVGLFAATSAVSAFAHRIFTARRGY